MDKLHSFEGLDLEEDVNSPKNPQQPGPMVSFEPV